MKKKQNTDHISEDANIIEVKPQPGVYTVLMIISILFLSAAIYFVGNRLTKPTTTTGSKVGGYGLELGQILTKNPAEVFKKQKAKSYKIAEQRAETQK